MGLAAFSGGPVACWCVKERIWSACLIVGSVFLPPSHFFEPSVWLFVGVGIWKFLLLLSFITS